MKRREKGFTLAELLVAMAILAFTLSALVLLFLHCIFLNEDNRQISLATNHAQYVLEGVKHVGFAQVATEINNGNWDWNTAAITAAGLSALNNESVNSAVAGADPLTVTVTVSWDNRRQENQSLNLQTIITDY